MGGFYDFIINLRNLVDSKMTFKSGIHLDFITIFVFVILFFTIIGVGLLYGKDKQQQLEDKKYRTITSVFLGFAISLAIVFTMILIIAYTGSGQQTTAPLVFMSFKLMILLYFFGVYCIFPLVIYTANGEDIYYVEDDDSKRYENTVAVIRIITNILILLAMMYSIWLVLWYRNDIIKKRQLLIPVIMLGIVATGSIKNIIYNFTKTPNTYVVGYQ